MDFKKGGIMLKKLSPAAFDEYVKKAKKPCLVMVSRDTCHVCETVHPKLEALSEEYPDFPFYEVNVNQMQNLLLENRLKGVPQTLFYKGGKVESIITGDASEDDFADKIDELLED